MPNILSAIGIRTCFDIASDLLNIDSTLTFAQKLTALTEANHIREAERENLSVLVKAGNASAHRGWKPSANDLNILANTLEAFIDEAFIKPEQRRNRAEQLNSMKRRVPEKQSRMKVAEIAKLNSNLTPNNHNDI